MNRLLNGVENNKENRGLVFNVQRFSVHDGPGIRTTVFMKGCALNCRWCSNPESLRPYRELMTSDFRCVMCGRCAEVCPQAAIILNKRRKIDRLRCDLCLKCANVCPTGALKAVGQFMTTQEVMSEIKRDELFYQNSGGGVTISGGEPLIQWRFVLNLLKECKLEAMNTAVDTCGYAQWEILSKVLEYVDLCLYDIKHTEPRSHRWGTGKSNSRIIENLYLTAARVRTWLRIPLIPGYNDSKENILSMVRLAKKSKVEKVSILPYHNYGKAKYKQLGRHYRLGHVKMPINKHIQGVCELFKTATLNVTIGY